MKNHILILVCVVSFFIGISCAQKRIPIKNHYENPTTFNLELSSKRVEGLETAKNKRLRLEKK